MSLVLTFLVVVNLLLAVSLLYAARFFLKREDGWRQREMVLIDRLLKQAHVAPVAIERENVIKLPDPEVQPETWIDQAFFTDEIKEELEQVYPEVARMTHNQAKDRYAAEWRRIEQHLRERQTPLRAE